MASAIVKLRPAIALPILLLVISGSLCPAHAAQRASNKSLRSALGTLKVWVPAGMIGDDYWIYLNGRLRSAPPHGPTNPRSSSFITVALGGIGSDGSRKPNEGWELWTRDGLALRMRHENFDGLLTKYLDPPAEDALHIFQVYELQLRPGQYTLEIAILSRGGPNVSPYTVNSFPFVVTQKYVADIQSGQVTKLYPGVPDDWSETRVVQALSVDRLCRDGQAPPDTDQLEGWLTEYVNDPMVKALRGASPSSLSPLKGVVVLNLPLAQGGSRDFDSSQITYIVDAIRDRGYLPSHSEIATCRGRLPQFSRSYEAYDKMISSIDTDIESFRKLAADLKPDR